MNAETLKKANEIQSEINQINQELYWIRELTSFEHGELRIGGQCEIKIDAKLVARTVADQKKLLLDRLAVAIARMEEL